MFKKDSHFKESTFKELCSCYLIGNEAAKALISLNSSDDDFYSTHIRLILLGYYSLICGMYVV